MRHSDFTIVLWCRSLQTNHCCMCGVDCPLLLNEQITGQESDVWEHQSFLTCRYTFLYLLIFGFQDVHIVFGTTQIILDVLWSLFIATWHYNFQICVWRTRLKQSILIIVNVSPLSPHRKLFIWSTFIIITVPIVVKQIHFKQRKI